ncbi:hypothetical protein [Aureibacter tunicatorum]|uniref:Uncharacterized protein n=1 Tax=Aureibacter tunicatorum TaxID=866807 RepID=A0AAE3XQB8_9BACT|nr:hypothetical protein [Aureibacter tunicatorum]MDR6240089.1 hypothetical protein [Aureibacter tunicatorum]BDD04560.1 hypothetical protein AUTU_20430 [Aureibacter tunicatorum]
MRVLLLLIVLFLTLERLSAQMIPFKVGVDQCMCPIEDKLTERNKSVYSKLLRLNRANYFESKDSLLLKEYIKEYEACIDSLSVESSRFDLIEIIKVSHCPLIMANAFVALKNMNHGIYSDAEIIELLNLHIKKNESIANFDQGCGKHSKFLFEYMISLGDRPNFGDLNSLSEVKKYHLDIDLSEMKVAKHHYLKYIFDSKYYNTGINALAEFQPKEDKEFTYQQIKSSIISAKNSLPKVELDSVSALFEFSLLHRIIPQWEGTLWSFEGHTSIPKKGYIACGYFVSTTLQDVGIKLNRYKLAQQLPINEARSLAFDQQVITITEFDYLERIKKIKEHISDGIHFIGFDEQHVGYVLKQRGQLYIIHSNNLGEGKVMIENAEYSDAFYGYAEVHIVELSNNQKLLEAWINGNEIKIVM